MGCGADIEANALINSLTAGDDFTIPVVDLDDDIFKFPGGTDGPLYQAVAPITVAQLTERKVDGEGVFDALMTTFSAHLLKEYERNRITGADYTKSYASLTEGAMANAVAFLLGKDQAFWQAQQAQVQAITARVQLETAKVQLAAVQLEAMNQKAGYALTKMKLATESNTYCIAKFTLEQMLPQQLLGVKEQTEAQRGQTADTRLDGAVVAGVMGKQKLLYAQQITSYQRDSEVKAAKLFTDAWITQKTLDEGLLPPNGFTNASVDTVLAAIKANNGLN